METVLSVSAIATTMQVQYELMPMLSLVAMRQDEKEKREHTCETQNDHITKSLTPMRVS